MSTASPVPEREELAELRRRAYGPEPDLTRAEALRLYRLEEARRHARVRYVTVHDPETVTGAPGGAAAGGEGSASAGEACVVDAAPGSVSDHGARDDSAITVFDEAAAPQRSGPPRRRQWPRGSVVPWMWALCGAACGAAVVAGTWALSVPRPDITLEPVDPATTGLVEVPSDLEAELERGGSISTRFEDYSGAALFGQAREDGGRCLVAAAEEGPFSVGCAPAGLAPVMDVPASTEGGFTAVDPRTGEGLPDGSTVRFTWESESGLQGWVALVDGEATTGFY
ncbi:hypothetical protein R2Q81_07445 [Microbacterium aquimaris]|uniref:hypothetical protein n=1 Tax=Microbacterium aquimaris TaxID=459816 RepID=UPI002AD4A222|nr:hypothetical protein [Microbacterium aquimaris]MDZ8275783.1 hypothetical protein [Microbacterium aquimaris]